MKKRKFRTIAYVRATGIFDDSRATKEILALSEIADEIKVLSWNRKGNSKTECDKIFSERNNISFCYFDYLVPGSIGYKNLDKLIAWNKWVYKQLSLCENLDVVHACNLDAGIGSYRFCKKNSVNFVYDIYDYYVDSHKIPSVLKNIVEHLEIKIINFADITVICTEERREQISKAHPRKIVVIHNSPDVSKVDKAPIKYDYAYCGTLGTGRLIKEILEQYPCNSDLKFIFAGSGTYETEASSLARRFENFNYLGTIPYSTVLRVESESKVISAIYEPTNRNHRLCAPNKFYEALGLGKPVIVCEGTGIDKIVQKHKVGCVIEYKADDFYEKLRKLIHDNEEYENGNISKDIFDKEFSWNIMKDRLVMAYQSMHTVN